MKKWFIADTHFSHANIIRYAKRPFASVEEMNQCLIDNWNSCVDVEDQVYFLGDFGLGDVDHLHSICSRLNGNKICIRGNHDRNTNWMHRVGFDIVFESAFLKIGRHIVELIHIPSDQPPDHFQLHGHVHDKRPRKIISNQLNLCVEVWDYKPASEKAILSLLDQAFNTAQQKRKRFQRNWQMFAVVKKLNLPIGQYAITGSGALGIRGLRKIGDVDIIVTDELWKVLAAKYGIKDERGVKKIVFPDGIVEALGECSFYTEKKDQDAPTIAERIAEAEMIEGLLFESLEHVLYYKRKMGREKDIRDVQIIEEWQRSKQMIRNEIDEY